MYPFGGCFQLIVYLRLEIWISKVNVPYFSYIRLFYNLNADFEISVYFDFAFTKSMRQWWITEPQKVKINRDTNSQMYVLYIRQKSSSRAQLLLSKLYVWNINELHTVIKQFIWISVWKTVKYAIIFIDFFNR